MAGASEYQTYAPYGQKFAAQYGVPWPIFAGLIQQESGWNPYVWGDSGQAYGLGQLHKGAASDVGVDRMNPIQNLQGSAAYLAQQYKATGNWTDALAAYNQGIGKYQNSSGQSYAASVLANAKSYAQDGNVLGNAIADTSTGSKGTTNAIGTGGQTGGEYLQQQQQNAANNLPSALGAIWGTAGNYWNNGPGKLITPGLGDAATGAGAVVGGVAGSTLSGAQQASSILPGNVSSLIDTINSMFTAEFWQTAAPYIIIAIAAIGFILLGGLNLAVKAKSA